jgi:DUF1365 family protein
MHSSIFRGRVKHWRNAPVAHAFEYGVFMMYLDLEELDEVFENRWLWSTSGPALARFKRENYFGDAAEPLHMSVRNLVQEKTGTRPTGPIRLLTNLSYFGYCFNPISLYYCFDAADQRLETVVAEVSNTPWGERHCYVLPDEQNTGSEQSRRFRVEKNLHVSPFMGMNMSYSWVLTEPAENLLVRIHNETGDELLFGATLNLIRRPITPGSLAGILVRYPFMTLKVMFGIHWQALKLWIKGCPIETHPNKKPSVGVGQ